VPKHRRIQGVTAAGQLLETLFRCSVVVDNEAAFSQPALSSAERNNAA
jgi:hypothetical protein